MFCPTIDFIDSETHAYEIGSYAVKRKKILCRMQGRMAAIEK